MISSGFVNSSNSVDLVDNFNVPFADGAFMLIGDIDDNILESVLELEEDRYSASPVHSIDSSDDYDFLSIVNDDMLPISEFGSSDLIDSINFDDLDWVALTSEEVIEKVSTNKSDVYSSSIKVPRKKTKSSRKPGRVPNTKSWSRMSTEERLKTAHALSQIISHRMDFGDQMEVIKLINPGAVLSPNATEFSINLSHLNNSKLKRIKEYVRKHAFLQNDEIKNSSFRDLLMDNSKASSSGCRPAKRKQRCKSLHSKEQSGKTVKQGRKKKPSEEFFVLEKVIKLSNPEENEEEVNILE